MTKIKINSNPYKQEIKYETYKENSQEWVDVGLYSPNGKLREEFTHKCFLPFNAKEILEIIKDEYYIENKGAIEIEFEGTKEEYTELEKVAQQKDFEGVFIISRSNQVLDNAKFILSDTKEVFTNIKPVIEEVANGELEITKNLAKVSDALDDIVPICVFGNYSAGKSTFINALIGREVLPSGGDPVTAKAFKIQNSPQNDVARIKFSHWDDEIEISFEDDSYRVIRGNASDDMILELDSVFKEKK